MSEKMVIVYLAGPDSDRKLRFMWNLIKQWRLMRWINHEIDRHEEDQQVITFGTGLNLEAKEIIKQFSEKQSVYASAVKIRKTLNDCVDKKFLEADSTANGPYIRITGVNGREFIPFVSGLINAELKELGAIWSFVLGFIPFAVWLILHFSKIIK